jgi:exodeoxyribonuclease VII large subunit
MIMNNVPLKEILSVSALNERIKSLLEAEFAFVRVEGEVSNLSRPSSGHTYFTLKDGKSQIRAVIFRNPYGMAKKNQPGFDLEEGMSIICIARLTVYQPRGEYQLIIETIEPRGLGALQKAFEQLKEKLAAEGLFDSARKKPIPFLPQKIAVITSPTGAVVRDILTVTRRRFGSVDILLAPVRVQGSEAPFEIINALNSLQLLNNIDVIILARGGGSLEDLAPFNDEGVARAIAACRIPIISAVGHETDFTIADFTADLRAPTPSAAAELVVPLRTELLENIDKLRRRLILGLDRNREQHRQRVAMLRKHIRDPRRLLADKRLAVDDYSERITLQVHRIKDKYAGEVRQLSHRLQQRRPLAIIEKGRMDLADRQKAILTAWDKITATKKSRSESLSAVLSSLNPFSVLTRGYSIARRHKDNHIIRSPDDVSIGETIEILLSEGKLGAKIAEL